MQQHPKDCECDVCATRQGILWKIAELKIELALEEAAIRQLDSGKDPKKVMGAIAAFYELKDAEDQRQLTALEAELK
jgi:hypothetical protein